MFKLSPFWALPAPTQVGSDSAQGAGGPVMRDTITRVARLLAQVRWGGGVRGCLPAVLQPLARRAVL